MTPHVPLHSEDYVVAAIFSIIVGVNALVLFPRVVPSLHRRLKRAALITGAIVSVLTFMIVIETRAQWTTSSEATFPSRRPWSVFTNTSPNSTRRWPGTPRSAEPSRAPTTGE